MPKRFGDELFATNYYDEKPVGKPAQRFPKPMPTAKTNKNTSTSSYVSTEQIEDACAAYYGADSWRKLCVDDPALAENYRSRQRAAFTAAGFVVKGDDEKAHDQEKSTQDYSVEELHDFFIARGWKQIAASRDYIRLKTPIRLPDSVIIPLNTYANDYTELIEELITVADKLKEAEKIKPTD